MTSKADSEGRAPFKMIETRIWADEKFVKLSRAQPSGQFLFLYLFAGPHTLQPRMVPGVYRVSRAGLADELGWPLEDFDACFREIFGLHMAEADWDHQILWLPNVLKRSMPRSPHNVIGWRAGWDMMPDCALKRRIYRATRGSIHALGESFSKAFDASIKAVQLGSGVISKKVKEATKQGGPSANHKPNHKRTMSLTMSKPKADNRPDHKRTIDRTITEPSTQPSANHPGGQILDKRYKNNPKVKGVNGATAPLTARARVRESDGNDESPEAPPGNALSEFASVRRFTASKQCEHSQGDLLDDDAGKPLSDKDFMDHPGDHKRTITPPDGSAMVPPKVGRKSSKPAPAKAHGPDTKPTWDAYTEAFVARYGVEPVRNAVVNAQMLHFVERVGEAEAPAVARFYVEACSSSWYVKRCHAVGVLLQDAESLHTQWATHRPVTATEAAMADRTATNASAFAPLIAEARERERNEAKHDH